MFSSLDKWEVVNYSLSQRNVPFPTTSEAQAFFHMYHSYSEITNPSDRMRWCRYSLGLLQKDVAAMVGMEEWLYRDLESGIFHRHYFILRLIIHYFTIICLQISTNYLHKKTEHTVWICSV